MGLILDCSGVWWMFELRRGMIGASIMFRGMQVTGVDGLGMEWIGRDL